MMFFAGPSLVHKLCLRVLSSFWLQDMTLKLVLCASRVFSLSYCQYFQPAENTILEKKEEICVYAIYVISVCIPYSFSLLSTNKWYRAGVFHVCFLVVVLFAVRVCFQFPSSVFRQITMQASCLCHVFRLILLVSQYVLKSSLILTAS